MNIHLPTSNIQVPASGRRRQWFPAFGLAVALYGVAALAAPTNGIPGSQDYRDFSKFITDRNIFDPNRQPHNYSNTPFRPRPRISHGTPGIQLVGTMSYAKGYFAFFNGNSDDYQKTLQVGDKIVGYTVTEITPAQVVLESADKKERLPLMVGDGLRLENSKWVPAKPGELAITPGASQGGSSSGSEAAPSAPSAPASDSAPNDILKRLMQQREKENQ